MARVLVLLLLAAPELAAGIVRRGKYHELPGAVDGNASVPQPTEVPVATPTEGPRTFALLTSAFLPEKKIENPHSEELFAALGENLQNPEIGEVHVLMESTACNNTAGLICGDWSEHLRALIRDFSPDVNDVDMEKLRCVPAPGGKQPTYRTFFEYAMTAMAGKFVVLANTDVVFDETLGLVDKEHLARGENGMVLSISAAPNKGRYASVFHTECHASPKCTLWNFRGWNNGGNSWDAYLFQSVPEVLSRMNLTHIDIFMNLGGAEKRAGYQLEAVAGMQLSNPCLRVKAFHWHCRGHKMHENSVRADRPLDGTALGGITPCWDCPGVRMNSGEAPFSELCAKGHANRIQNPLLRQVFQRPDATWLCCAEDPCDEEYFLKNWQKSAYKLNWCNGRSDVKCVMKEAEAPQHVHYTWTAPDDLASPWPVHVGSLRAT
mmetsp:Transcript_42556/g.131801  ORF Transcript_42556/g.131801 Transcript_42556/m.131801 type:complete len:435 (-) Transcript_42556:60-1364(-)